MKPDRGAVRRRGALALLAVVAFGAGVATGAADGDDGPVDTAREFLESWQRQDYLGMHRLLTPASRSRTTRTELRDAYRETDAIATLRRRSIPNVRVAAERGGLTLVRANVVATTNAFGRIQGTIEVPVGDEGIEWGRHLTFPGLREGERLEARSTLGDRGRILASNRSVLAEGASDGRSHPQGPAATDVTGELGAPLAADAGRFRALGYPTSGPVGISGLERALQERLAGRPGGRLFAVRAGSRRQLASRAPGDGRDVVTTIRPAVQAATVTGLAGRLGGVATIDARTGEILGLAGLAYSAPQPPGSTFKVITAAAALEAGVAKMDSRYPVATEATVGGRTIANASRESCGGTFVQSFAHSCNSVFAPLGARLGSQRLVDAAERFGFNREPQIFDPATGRPLSLPRSSLPSRIDSELDLGVTAIGQGRVLATPLLLASISQTVASGGLRHPTPIATDRSLRPAARPVRAVPREIARRLRRLMLAVVRFGTGRAAALTGVQVAGKTGTAELGVPKRGADPSRRPLPGEAEEQEVNAWFTAFAPADRPRVAVAVMLVNAPGDGGEVAAPIAREVLRAALVSTAPRRSDRLERP